MLEFGSKLVYFILASTFILGGWVAGIQLTMDAHGKAIDKVDVDNKTLGNKVDRILETVIRVDERTSKIVPGR